MGANGFIGMHVLGELLDDDRVGKVYALVRGNGATGGRERLAGQLRQYRMVLPRSRARRSTGLLITRAVRATGRVVDGLPGHLERVG